MWETYHSNIEKLESLIENWLEDLEKTIGESTDSEADEYDDFEINQEIPKMITNQICIFSDPSDSWKFKEGMEEWRQALQILEGWSRLKIQPHLTIASLISNASEFHYASSPNGRRPELTPFRIKKIEEFATALTTIAKKGLTLISKLESAHRVIQQVQDLRDDAIALMWLNPNFSVVTNETELTSAHINWIGTKEGQDFLEELRISIEVEARFGGTFITVAAELAHQNLIYLSALHLIMKELNFSCEIKNKELMISWE